MRAIGGDGCAIRPRDEAAHGTRVARSGRNVVRVKKISEAFVKSAISGKMRRQQKLLEEPCGIRAVPLGRARIRHGLHALILGREQCRTTLGLGAYVAKRASPSKTNITGRMISGGC